ncbi:hypothetical protein DOM22_11855 [Bdellovibrio sp. ZAP7]|uniref:hypothetical protein n=1 Tax=Bdellovibrio sp. ZAP7 TaxID=2231053 RepID=UPI0011577B0B|nr:hypothetical protein [Bdellovibrio sp. ZAP7]QDK45792.1 hypothetical protein DOM22_11855 [Bdellovibrio sp. ZAP7]
MNTFKSLVSVMVVTLAVVGCDSKSNDNNGNTAEQVVTPSDQSGAPYGGYQMADEPGTYSVAVNCADEIATQNLPDVAMKFTLKRNGSYLQEIVSLERRCRQDCYLRGEGTFLSSAEGMTFNQRQIVSSNRAIVQGVRNNTYTRKFSPITSRKSGLIVLVDKGSNNMCGGPMELYLTKDGGTQRR